MNINAGTVLELQYVLMYSWGLKTGKTFYCLLRCNLYSDGTVELLHDICALKTHKRLLNILLHRLDDFRFSTNNKVIKSIIKFLETFERFIGRLF